MDGGVPGSNRIVEDGAGGRPGQASVTFRISRQIAPQRACKSTECHLVTVRRTRARSGPEGGG